MLPVRSSTKSSIPNPYTHPTNGSNKHAKMSFVPVNPRPFLQDLVNKDVVVRLKWGETEYKGRLVVRTLPLLLLAFTLPLPSLRMRATSKSGGGGQVELGCHNAVVKKKANEGVGAQSIDSYMNIQLSNTEEFIDRKFTGALGQVLIRYVETPVMFPRHSVVGS